MIQINHSFVVALYYHQNDTNSILFVENLISLKDKIVRRRKTFEKKETLESFVITIQAFRKER